MQYRERLTVAQLRQRVEALAPFGVTVSDFKRIENNTARASYSNGSEVVIHFDTAIWFKEPDGTIIVNAWDSVTTRARLNALLPSGLRLTTVKGNQWLVDIRNGRTWDNAHWHEVGRFVIQTDGQISGGYGWAIGPNPGRKYQVTERPHA